MKLCIFDDGKMQEVTGVEYFEVLDNAVYVVRDGVEQEFDGQLGSGQADE